MVNSAIKIRKVKPNLGEKDYFNGKNLRLVFGEIRRIKWSFVPYPIGISLEV